VLPLLPLDIKISGAQPRGTKRSAAVAAHIDEDRNEGRDREPEPRKVVTPIGRRTTRSSFLALLRPQLRRRVGDGLEAAENTPDELWVAVGEVGPPQ
jgi:hypothetical protein